MSNRRGSRTILALLSLVALVLITVDYRLEGEGATGAARRGAVAVFSPLQSGFARVVSPIPTFLSLVGQLGSLREENAALEQELAELSEQLVNVADLERENDELRDLLEMSERLELTTTAARVIGQPPGEQGSTILVEAGHRSGVEVGMAVVSARGLVGKVIEVTRSHARVELVTSPEARYAVRVASTAETGLLRGRGSDPFQLELLDRDATAEPGEEVVTRSFQASTIPDGLIVGEVTGLDREGGPNNVVEVRPFVDFRRLTFVQVVLDAPEVPGELRPFDLIDPRNPPRPVPLDERPDLDVPDPPPLDGVEDPSQPPNQSPDSPPPEPAPSPPPEPAPPPPPEPASPSAAPALAPGRPSTVVPGVGPPT